MENLQNQEQQQDNINQLSRQNPKKQIPSWLGFVIIAVAIILLFGGVFAWQYFVTQKAINQPQVQSQTNQTAGWKTYTNTQYGFELKYPAEFERDGLPNENDNLFLKVNNIDPNNTIRWINMGIAFGMKGLYSFEDFGIDYDNKKVVLENKNVTIYKIPAIPDKKSVTFISIGSPTPAIDVTSLIQENSNLIKIEIYGSQSANVKDLEKLSDQMLSTFKFTNSQPVVGGDKDAHGCIGSAGYSWCEVKNKCLRIWEEKCEADQIAGWKTYSDQQISFKYPTDWDQIRKNNLLGEEGNYFVSDYSVNKPISISAYSVGTKPFEQTIFNKKQVNINWTTEQFAQNMGFSPENVLFTKKLGNKSILVAIYENYECSPGIIVSVLTPFNPSFPNIDFRAWKLGENKDIKNLIDKHGANFSAGKADPCDWYDIIKAEADKIYNGTYSVEASQNIETATQMAESIILK